MSRVLLGLVVALASSRAAEATTVAPASLEACLRYSQVVFVGTVSSLEYQEGGKGIYTRLVFRDLVPIRGVADDDSLVLRLKGGESATRIVFTIGQPTFEPGERYAVLAHLPTGSGEDQYSSLVDVYLGYFPIFADEPAGAKVVHDYEFRPIARVESGHIVAVEHPIPPGRGADSPHSLPSRVPNPPRPRLTGADTVRTGADIAEIVLPAALDPRSRMSEAAFVAMLRTLDRRR